MSLAVLEAWFLRSLAPEVGTWYGQGLVAARVGGLGAAGFASCWSGAGRRLGRAAAALSDADVQALRAAGAPFVPAGWGADEVGRGLLLLTGAAATPDAAARGAAIDDLFRLGEMREQQAVLRVLAYLPDPKHFAALAADAVRSNVLSVLEALACDNPYPAAHMSELAFNQMVMKAIFNGLPLARIVGLAARNNDELRRIVGSFKSERNAAGRPVPDDLGLILPG